MFALIGEIEARWREIIAVLIVVLKRKNQQHIGVLTLAGKISV